MVSKGFHDPPMCILPSYQSPRPMQLEGTKCWRGKHPKHSKTHICSFHKAESPLMLLIKSWWWSWKTEPMQIWSCWDAEADVSIHRCSAQGNKILDLNKWERWEIRWRIWRWWSDEGAWKELGLHFTWPADLISICFPGNHLFPETYLGFCIMCILLYLRETGEGAYISS